MYDAIPPSPSGAPLPFPHAERRFRDKAGIENGRRAEDREATRWSGVERPYTAADVARLRGSVQVQHTLADMGARRLWQLLQGRRSVRALGALTGGQAVQMVRAGLEAVYVGGSRVAAVDSVPRLVRRINQALLRADQIEHAQGRRHHHWMAPLVADAEAGFGGPLSAFELMREMIDAGAAGVHFEDQLSSEEKVLVPTGHFVRTLVAARLAADVAGVPTILIARTDADGAKLLTADVDERDRPFCTGERTGEGFFRVEGGIEMAIARALAYAPYCDLLWCETSTPNLEEARRFAEGVHARYPRKMLAYNCSPSFNWRKLDDPACESFGRELAAMGYRFQFVTRAGFHSQNHAMFQLAKAYKERGMAAYAALQQEEFAAETDGYTATRHQREVGTGYFDAVTQVISGGLA